MPICATVDPSCIFHSAATIYKYISGVFSPCLITGSGDSELINKAGGDLVSWTRVNLKSKKAGCVRLCLPAKAQQRDSSLPSRQSNTMCRQVTSVEVWRRSSTTTLRILLNRPVNISVQRRWCWWRTAACTHTHGRHVTRLRAQMAEHLNNRFNLFAYSAPMRRPGKNVGPDARIVTILWQAERNIISSRGNMKKKWKKGSVLFYSCAP